MKQLVISAGRDVIRPRVMIARASQGTGWQGRAPRRGGHDEGLLADRSRARSLCDLKISNARRIHTCTLSYHLLLLSLGSCVCRVTCLPAAVLSEAYVIGTQVHLRNIQVTFIYQGHWVKHQITGHHQ